MTVPTPYIDQCFKNQGGVAGSRYPVTCRRSTVGWAKVYVDTAGQRIWRRYCLLHLKELVQEDSAVDLDDAAALAVILEA
jgi:hypothetical protein